MNEYEKLKSKHADEFASFPMKFAFSKESFAKGMSELGLTPDRTDQIYAISGGGFYLRSEAHKLHTMLDRHHEEIAAAVASDKTGTGFIYEMFLTELSAREFAYTSDYTETLEALGYKEEDVINNPALRNGFNKACKKIQNSTVDWL